MADEPSQSSEPRLWRLHSDAVNSAFVTGAIAGRRFDHALKTDLFDEAVTTGIVPLLAGVAERVSGVDVSAQIVAQAACHQPRLEARIADIRRLPFADDTFDLVVSLSTLDHLDNVDEIAAAIGEIARVLVPGGTLALTVDNRANPVVALRNALPGGALRRARLVAYETGATIGPRQLERLVRAAGLRPRASKALMHCPRLPAVVAARCLAGSPSTHARFLRVAASIDALDRLPTRYLTGYFAAIVAERAAGSSPTRPSPKPRNQP